MTILRSNIALVMIGLSIFIFLMGVTLNGYSETMNAAELDFAVNFLAIFSVLFMGVGIYLAIFNKSTRRKIHRHGHHFETMPGRRG